MWCGYPVPSVSVVCTNLLAKLVISRQGSRVNRARPESGAGRGPLWGRFLRSVPCARGAAALRLWSAATVRSGRVSGPRAAALRNRVGGGSEPSAEWSAALGPRGAVSRSCCWPGTRVDRPARRPGRRPRRRARQSAGAGVLRSRGRKRRRPGLGRIDRDGPADSVTTGSSGSPKSHLRARSG